MHLIALGLNHKTAPLDIRELFSLNQKNIREQLAQLLLIKELNEAVIISTCNRMEVYAVVDEKEKGFNSLKRFFSSFTGGKDTEEYLYSFFDEECAKHLFSVAASLDSLVLGEGQILSQVKDSYLLSHEEGGADTILNLLFHRAITVGKRVRTETKIAFNPVSVSSAAVEMAKKKLGTLKNSSALIFGAGKMAELMAQHLKSQGIKCLYVANRHLKRAQDFAKEFGGVAVPFLGALSLADEVDVIFTSTGAPHYVVRADEINELMKKRYGRELFVIDIAVPRDVEPQIADIEGVTLYNIDDLTELVAEHRQKRVDEAKKAEGIVKEELDGFFDKLRYLSCRPVMLELSESAEKIRRRELKRAFTKLSLDENEERVIENLTRMLTRKLLREPMRKVSAFAGTTEEKYYQEAMRSLFNLKLKEDRE